MPKYTIYKIIDNSTSKVVYVGITKRTLKARLQGHSDHKDSPIYKLIKAKGKGNFSIRPIDFAKCQKEGWIKEEFWTRFFRGKGVDLYNRDFGKSKCAETIIKLSLSHKGHKVTKAQRNKVSKANKGRFMGIEHLRSKCVKCQENNQVYGSISEASRMSGVAIASIARVCKGERKSAGGYHWEYATKEDYYLCRIG